MPSETKNLVLVLATSTPGTETRGEAVETAETAGMGKNSKKSEDKDPNLVRVPCIWYLITFHKKSVPVLVLFDSGSEVNAIYPNFTQELGFSI